MPANPWQDVNVQDALAEGRDESDISLIQCQQCHHWAYYNEGSHFTCPDCDWTAEGRRLDDIIETGGVITLFDFSELMAAEEPMP